MSGYIGFHPIPRATRVLSKGEFILASQTIDLPFGFTPGNIVVYIDGNRLYDFDDTSAVSVDLLVQYPSGTKYIVEEFRTFELADHYTKIESDNTFVKKTDWTSNQSIVTNGYQLEPGGILRQWQLITGLSGVGTNQFDLLNQVLNFTIPYPTQVLGFNVIPIDDGTYTEGSELITTYNSVTLSGVDVNFIRVRGDNVSGTETFNCYLESFGN